MTQLDVARSGSVIGAGRGTTTPRSRPASTERDRSRGFFHRYARLLDVVVLLTVVTLIGSPYYLVSAGERLRSPLHDWFKPSGYVGQTAGIVAFALFVFLWLYPLRKKFRALAFTGSIGRWLDVHIVAGLAIPWIGAIHAAWKFEGLIGLGYLAMLTVSLSGLVGRYLYTRIPRNRSGLELGRDEVNRRREEIIGEVAGLLGIDVAEVAASLEAAARTGGGRRFVVLISSDLARWRAVRRLKRDWRRLDPRHRRVGKHAFSRAMRLVRREIALTQQIRMLDATHRLFRYWHVAHRPVAITALVAVMIHVVTVVYLGVTWFR